MALTRLEALIVEASERGFKTGLKLANVTGFTPKGNQQIGWFGNIEKAEWELLENDGKEVLQNNGVTIKFGDKWAVIL